ncbi:hypothetical protein H257_17720 [Aphanomyces astaci]|uniref:Uncharacterized protein n=1 Tax=Aphanomyces astaci TaxID=112090 RepID=W4FFK7_APHAT|nr:hypothetical protein H257_17720 [Aphanomyces astaci]ETV65611.1 hypothetical protein H257_17720 [Aphanomyces astaci]|eukprot:XP_009844908.1 hypothetical protein H257_17720 [Aphanomyces astaci]
MESKHHSRLATIGGQGHKQFIPFGPTLLEFMRSRRGDERYVRVFHMMTWVKKNHHAWPVEYLSTKKNESVGLQSFRCLLLLFAERHRYYYRMPCASKRMQKVLDDTAVCFDMPRGKTLAEVGTSSKYTFARGTRTKLPLLFIVKSQPDGTIEKQELSHTRLAITTQSRRMRG